MSDLARLMEEVARRLLGVPNKHLSKAHELRYGTKGSFSVDLTKGAFFDHEANKGGGVLDLIKLKTNGADAIEWLRSAQLIGEDIEAIFDYRDEDGALLSQVVRKAGKKFSQRQPVGDGWAWDLDGVRRVPYRLPELLAGSGEVFIPEGEKHVDALLEYGFQATCNPGGAGKWRDEYSEFLRDRDVLILPDNDEAGRKHAESIAASLKGIARRIRLLPLPELEPKGDVLDWLAAGGEASELQRLADAAPDWTPQAEAPQNNTSIMQVGEWVLQFGNAADPLIEDADGGEIVGRAQQGVLYGPQGTGKTAVAMEFCLAVESGGMGHVPFGAQPLFRAQKGRVLFAIYEDPFDYRRRMLALAKTRGVDLSGLNWGMVGADKNITNERDRAKLLEEIRDDAAVYGPPALLVIDTIAAALGGESTNDDDVVGKLFALSQALVREFECTVIFVAHPGKDETRGIAGSYRFQGNSDFILHTVETKSGFRLLKDKDRNGPKRALFDFTLNFVEVERTTSGKPRTGAIIGMMTACLQESYPQHVRKERWSRALRILVSAMEAAVVTHGAAVVPEQKVRSQFNDLYEGQASAKKNAYRRGHRMALERGLLEESKINGVPHVSFADKSQSP